MSKFAKRLGRYFWWWLISGLTLIVFIVATNPLNLPLPVLLVPFAALLVWIRSSVIGISLLVSRLEQPTRKLRVSASALAAIILVIVTLQSLGQLSWRDLILTVSLVLGLIFYLAKTDVI